MSSSRSFLEVEGSIPGRSSCIPVEATEVLLEFLLAEEQTLVLSVDRRAAASSIATREQIGDQFRALSERSFDDLLEATDTMLELLLAEEQSSALAFERRLAASSAERRAEIVEQQRARAAMRFDELQTVRERSTLLWWDLERLQS
jgi:hypothetical protein